MKSFRFGSIYLLSQSEKRARKVTFAPRLNLIVGRNHTGKSSLIKSLFLAFGARPEGALDRWDKNAVVLVAFSIGEDSYFVVQQRSHRALFSGAGRCLYAAGNASDWGRKFAEVTGFNLVLTDQNQNVIPADARAFFLPFYINQDGSWHASWRTFASLQQYKSPVAAILDYFTGVKPPEYYEINSLKTVAQNALKELQREQRLINQVRERFGKAMPLAGPKTVPAIFEQDIARLTEEITQLNLQQEKLRDVQVREQEVLDSLRLQVTMAQETLKTYESDASFLRTEPHETLVCPTCGAEHNKTFMDMLTYAEDARVLRELVVRLQDDARKAAEVHGKTRERLRELDDRYYRVSQLLETRRGDLKFDDVVKSMGAEVAFEAFESELEALKAQIDRYLGEIESLEAKLEKLTSHARSSKILQLFRDSYDLARRELNLPPTDKKNLRLVSRPDISGSGGPRSILAYYSALWRTSFSEFGSFYVPLVIDSPQQQGQDEINLPKIIEYVAKKLPEQAQVLLGVESATTERFDNVIELDDPYRILQEDEYEDVSATVEPYLTQMYASLFGEGAPNT